MKTKWRVHFMRMLSELHANPLIQVEKENVAPPATQEQLTCLNPYSGTELGDQLRSFYAEMNGLELVWKTRPGSPGTPIITGLINLWDVERVFGNPEGQPPYPGRPAGDRAFKPFDFFVAEACAALIISPDNEKHPVYFQSFGERPVNTFYSFNEYLDRLLVSRGFWYWIQSLAPETKDNPEFTRFLEIAPLLFPGFQAQLFIPKER